MTQTINFDPRKIGGQTAKTVDQLIEDKGLKYADVRDFPVMDPRLYPDVKTCSYDDYSYAVQEFNRMIGWPQSRLLNQPVPMVPYQIQYEYDVELYNTVIVNKTRKGAFTDGRIRGEARQTFSKYAGHDSLIVAGNELNVALEVLNRYEELFHNGVIDKDGKKWAYGDLIMRYSKSPIPMVEFYNGHRHFCAAASKSGKAQSFRGLDDVISVFFTEAAHSGALDDYPIYTALTPLLANRASGDLVFESTPNGKRGFYYDITMDAKSIPKKNHYHYIEVDYTEALKYGVLSKEYIDRQKKDPRVDFAQEYQCKFTTTKRAAIPEDEILTITDPDKQPEDLSKFLGYEDMRD